jgi:hypothetical protein
LAAFPTKVAIRPADSHRNTSLHTGLKSWLSFFKRSFLKAALFRGSGLPPGPVRVVGESETVLSVDAVRMLWAVKENKNTSRRMMG